MDRHRINKSIFDDKHIGRPMFYVLTRTPRSPFTNFIPQSSCRPAGPTTCQTCRPVGEAVGLGPTLIADTGSYPHSSYPQTMHHTQFVPTQLLPTNQAPYTVRIHTVHTHKPRIIHSSYPQLLPTNHAPYTVRIHTVRTHKPCTIRIHAVRTHKPRIIHSSYPHSYYPQTMHHTQFVPTQLLPTNHAPCKVRIHTVRTHKPRIIHSSYPQPTVTVCAISKLHSDASLADLTNICAR